MPVPGRGRRARAVHVAAPLGWRRRRLNHTWVQNSPTAAAAASTTCTPPPPGELVRAPGRSAGCTVGRRAIAVPPRWRYTRRLCQAFAQAAGCLGGPEPACEARGVLGGARDRGGARLGARSCRQLGGRMEGEAASGELFVHAAAGEDGEAAGLPAAADAYCTRVARCTCWRPPPIRIAHGLFIAHNAAPTATQYIPPTTQHNRTHRHDAITANRRTQHTQHHHIQRPITLTRQPTHLPNTRQHIWLNHPQSTRART